MQFFEVIPYGEALSLLIDAVSFNALRTRTLPLEECIGKILAKDVFSSEDLPPFHKSTVDGYAVKASDTYGASEAVPSLLDVIGSVKMGQKFPGVLRSGQAVAIPTGGMLPDGADAVVMVENCQTFGRQIAVNKSVPTGGNVLRKGDDVRKGERVVARGDLLEPFAMGALAGLGIAQLEVFDALQIGVISTGDELIGIHEEVSGGKIRDVNTYSLSALAKANGHSVSFHARCEDVEEQLTERIKEGAALCDIVLVSGGSSVGEKDYTYRAIERICSTVFLKGVALKPGKPTIAGRAGDTLIVGLPGHPMAAAIVFEILVQEAVRAVRGQRRKVLSYAAAKTNFPASPGRTTVQPVRLSAEGGRMVALPLFAKSGAIGALAKADGYIMIADNAEGVDDGQTVEVFGFGR